jgi:hypothetical protein
MVERSSRTFRPRPIVLILVKMLKVEESGKKKRKGGRSK